MQDEMGYTRRDFVQRGSVAALGTFTVASLLRLPTVAGAAERAVLTSTQRTTYGALVAAAAHASGGELAEDGYEALVDCFDGFYATAPDGVRDAISSALDAVERAPSNGRFSELSVRERSKLLFDRTVGRTWGKRAQGEYDRWLEREGALKREIGRRWGDRAIVSGEPQSDPAFMAEMRAASELSSVTPASRPANAWDVALRMASEVRVPDHQIGHDPGPAIRPRV